MGVKEFIARILDIKQEQARVITGITPEILEQLDKYREKELIQEKIKNREKDKQLKKYEEKIRKLEKGYTSQEQKILRYVEEQKKLQEKIENQERLNLVLDKKVRAIGYNRKPLIPNYTHIHRFELAQRDDGEYNVNIVLYNPDDPSTKKRVPTKLTFTDIADSIAHQAQSDFIVFNLTAHDGEVVFHGDLSREFKLQEVKSTINSLRSALAERRHENNTLHKELQDVSTKLHITRQEADNNLRQAEVMKTALEYTNAQNEALTKQTKTLIAETTKTLVKSMADALNKELTESENDILMARINRLVEQIETQHTDDDLEAARLKGREEVFETKEKLNEVLGDDKEPRIIKSKPVEGTA